MEDEERDTSSQISFHVTTDAYTGPFEILLQLIAQRKLEVTELALSLITEEFLEYVSAMDAKDKAEEASEFIVVASILVEAKSAALLPGSSLRNPEIAEALAERDLLFAHLLEYKAFKEAAADLSKNFDKTSRIYPHIPTLSAQINRLLRESVIGVTVNELSDIAVQVLEKKEPPTVNRATLHIPLADIHEQSAIIYKKLWKSQTKTMSFAELVSDAGDRGVVIARFLAVLAFVRFQLITCNQEQAYGEIDLKWVGTQEDYEKHLSLMGKEDFS